MMKVFPRFFVTVVMVMFITGLLVTPVRADAQELALTPTEEYVKIELIASREVDVSQLKDGDATIRGQVIVAWWKDPAFKNIPFFKIENAVIAGDIDAKGITIPFIVQFIHCEFNGNINLDGANTKTFQIENDSSQDDPETDSFEKIKAPSTVAGYVKMGRMIVDGDLSLYGSKFVGPVSLFDAKISGNLYAKNSRFEGTDGSVMESSYPFELWTIYVGEVTEFTGSTFYGKVMAANAEFGQDIRFQYVTFKDSANFTDFHVGELANFEGATFEKEVIFENGVVKRDIQFTGSTFNEDANFNYLSVGRFMNFSDTLLSSSEDSTGKSGTVFHGSVKFEGVQVGKILNFTNSKYLYSKEPFKIHLAEVEGQSWFNEFTSAAELDLSHNHFGDLRINGKKFASIKLDSTLISGDLYMQDIGVGNFSAQGLTVQDSTTFIQLKVTDDLNLSNASLGSFKLGSEWFWPDPKGTFNLRGATYTDINFVTLKDNIVIFQEFKGDQAGFLGKMVAASLYSPQAYRTLGTFLTEKGQSDAAAEMEYDRKVRVHRGLSPWSPSWLLSWFRWGFSGYGKYPWLAMLWSLVLIFISTLVFWFQRELPDGLKYKDGSQISSNHEKFLYCFLYSLFLFFSFVVLEFAKDWEPKETGTSFKAYKQFHKMLGLIIAPTAGLVFGGLIK